MKLSEAIETKNWSEFKLCRQSSFYNYYDELGPVLYPNGGALDDEHYDAVDETGRVKKYAVREWLCTDQYVGLYLYLVDDEPVCLMHQTGRKCYPDWSFLSDETFQIVRQLFDDYRPPDHQAQIPLVDDDIMHLCLDLAHFTHQASLIDMGLSPIMNAVSLIKTLDEADINKAKSFVHVLDETIGEHNDYMETMSDASPAALDRARDRSAEIFEKAVLLLDKLKNG
jgi:hypothetical protein